MSSNLDLLFWQNPNINKFSKNTFDKGRSNFNLQSDKALKNVDLTKMANNYVINLLNKAQNGKRQAKISEKKFNNTFEKEVFKNSLNSVFVSKQDKNFSSVNEMKSLFDREKNLIEKEKIIDNKTASEIRNNVQKERVLKEGASISVDMSGMKNSVSGDMDIDLLIRKLTEKLEDALVSSAEGVHYDV